MAAMAEIGEKSQRLDGIDETSDEESMPWRKVLSKGVKMGKRAYFAYFLLKEELYIHGGVDFNRGIFGDLWHANIFDTICTFERVTYPVDGLSEAALSSQY
jgi:hypothetical protein